MKIVIHRRKRKKTLNVVMLVENKEESPEFSRDKLGAKGSPLST